MSSDGGSELLSHLERYSTIEKGAENSNRMITGIHSLFHSGGGGGEKGGAIRDLNS